MFFSCSRSKPAILDRSVQKTSYDMNSPATPQDSTAPSLSAREGRVSLSLFRSECGLLPSAGKHLLSTSLSDSNSPSLSASVPPCLSTTQALCPCHSPPLRCLPLVSSPLTARVSSLLPLTCVTSHSHYRSCSARSWLLHVPSPFKLSLSVSLAGSLLSISLSIPSPLRLGTDRLGRKELLFGSPEKKTLRFTL